MLANALTLDADNSISLTGSFGSGPLTATTHSGDLSLTQSYGNLNTATLSAGNNLTLTTTASNANITLAGSVQAGQALTLITSGNGTISQSLDTPLSANTLTLLSDSGNITLHTNVSQLSGNTLGNISLTNDSALTVGSNNLLGNTVTLTTTTGSLKLDGIVQGNQINLSALSNSILAQGSGNHILANDNLTLSAAHVIGTTSNPLQLSINNGSLRLSAQGQFNGVSADIAGSVTANKVTLLFTPPGQIILNGTLLFPLLSLPTASHQDALSQSRPTNPQYTSLSLFSSATTHYCRPLLPKYL